MWREKQFATRSAVHPVHLRSPTSKAREVLLADLEAPLGSSHDKVHFDLHFKIVPTHKQFGFPSMLDRTGNIVLVGKMLGHSSVTTTQRYLHPSMKGLAELVNERNAMRAQEEDQ